MYISYWQQAQLIRNQDYWYESIWLADTFNKVLPVNLNPKMLFIFSFTFQGTWNKCIWKQFICVEHYGQNISYIKLVSIAGNPFLPDTHLSVKDLSC